MEFQIQIEPLRDRKLFIATPAYGGNENINFTHSLFNLQQMLTQCGINFEVNSIGAESLIMRARNKLVSSFMVSDCTDLIFIDADIEFDPVDVISLMHFASDEDKGVIGGAYPLKMIDWKQIKQAVIDHPEIDPLELAKMGARYASHCYEGQINMPDFTPIACQELATGFMLIRREALKKLAPHCKSYTPYSIEHMKEDRIVDFFPAGVEGDEYLSEDYFFCKNWRDLGEKVWLCPWIKLNHVGLYKYQGDPRLTAKLSGQLN